MAILQVFDTLDMFSLRVFYGEVTIENADRIVIESGYDRAIYGGTFTYAGNVPHGTVETFQLELSNTPVFAARGLQASAETLASYIQSGQARAAVEYALSGDDLVQGSSGSDILGAFAGADTMSGGFGDDQLFGGTGADSLDGSPGQDLLLGNQQNDTLLGGEGNDALYGGQDGDQLYGNLGMDALFGNMGDDQLYGGQGNDYLHGGQGNDILVGGVHDDTLQGGLGGDVFVFAPASANDVVVDFRFSEGDRIHVEGESYRIVDNHDGSTSLVLGDGGTVMLYGVTASDVSAAYFV